MSSVCMAFFAAFGLLEGHRVMHSSSSMIVGMLSTQFVHWMGRMVGVSSFHTIPRMVVEAEAEVDAVGVVEERI